MIEKLGYWKKVRKVSKVNTREILKGVGVNVSLIIIHWKPYATNNRKEKYLIIT